jgi:hypothetical protein
VVAVSAAEVIAEQGRFDRQLALVRDHWRSCRRLWLDHKEPLRAARLGDEVAPDFWVGAGLPGLATIRSTRDGRFDFANDGLTAVILPCYDCIPGMIDANAERHVGHLVDLVAVDLDQPDRFWRRRGEALILGTAYLEIARQEGEPVPVFRNPLTWLRAAGAGIVVLDWDYARDLLLDHELVAEDLDVAERLQTALKRDIWVREVAA